MVKQQPAFMQRMRARQEARKEIEKQEQIRAEKRRRELILALDIAAAVLNSGICRTPRRVRRNTKDVWSHLGDAVFGRLG